MVRASTLRRRTFAALWAIPWLWTTAAPAQVVPAFWLGTSPGAWTDPARWSAGVVPNNGVPPGSEYWTLIFSGGTVNLGSSVAVSTLSLSASSQLHHDPNPSSVLSTDWLNITDSAVYELRGGTLSVANQLSLKNNGYLLQSLGSSLVVNAMDIEDASFTRQFGTFRSTGTVTLRGTGSSVMEFSGGSATFDGPVVVETGVFSCSSFDLTLSSGMVVNAGTIQQNTGTINLNGTIAVAPGANAVFNGAIVGGTISAPGNIVRAGGTLVGTKLDSDLYVPDGKTLHLEQGAQFAGNRIELGRTVGGSIISGGAIQTGVNEMSGSIEIVMNHMSGLGGNTGTLTLGPGVTVRDGALGTTEFAYIGTGQARTVNQGTIAFAGTAANLYLRNVTNQGTINIANRTLAMVNYDGNHPAASLSITNGTLLIAGADPLDKLGVITRVNTPAFFNGTLNLAGGSIDLGTTAAGSVGLTGSAVLRDGTLTNSLGPIAAPGVAPSLNASIIFENMHVDQDISEIRSLIFRVVGSLNLHGHTLRAGSPNFVFDVSGNFIDVNGTLNLNGSNLGTHSGQLLEVAPNTVVRGNGWLTGKPLLNRGTVRVEPGELLRVGQGSWSNAGSFVIAGGVMILEGTYSPADIGTVVHTPAGGALRLTSTIQNTGTAIDTAVIGPVQLGFGTLLGGEIGGPLGSVTLAPGSGGMQLRNVTVRTNLTGGDATSAISFEGAGTLDNVSIQPTSGSIYLGAGVTLHGSGTFAPGSAIISSGSTVIPPAIKVELRSGTSLNSNFGTLNVQGPIRVTASPGPAATVVGFATLSTSTAVEAGTFDLRGGATGAISNTGTITVQSGAQLTAASFINRNHVNVQPGAFMLATGTLNNIGSISLDGALALNYSGSTPREAIRQAVLNGRAGGSWNGPGINSSLAGTNADLAVGLAEASHIGMTSTFLGRPVDSTTLLLRLTIIGDANLNGTVNLSDFSLLAANFNTSTYWARGDFNFDGVTSIGDFALLASHFNQSAPTPPLLRATVPEPAVPAVLFSAMWALSCRRQGNASKRTARVRRA